MKFITYEPSLEFGDNAIFEGVVAKINTKFNAKLEATGVVTAEEVIESLLEELGYEPTTYIF